MFRQPRLTKGGKTKVNKTSHSCEGRNLYRREAAGNCTLFTICAFGAEIPAFAGMGRVVKAKIRVNKEIPAFAGMAALFVFVDNTEFGGIRKYKKTPFRRKPESHSPQGESVCAFAQRDSCFRRNGISCTTDMSARDKMLK
ncbi:MAG: hypothetical protein ACR2QC_01245 [Gammaproteobacteria bacterium]